MTWRLVFFEVERCSELTEKPSWACVLENWSAEVFVLESLPSMHWLCVLLVLVYYCACIRQHWLTPRRPMPEPLKLSENEKPEKENPPNAVKEPPVRPDQSKPFCCSGEHSFLVFSGLVYDLSVPQNYKPLMSSNYKPIWATYQPSCLHHGNDWKKPDKPEGVHDIRYIGK